MFLMPGNQMLSPQQFSILGLGYKEGNLKQNATNGQVRMLSVFQRGAVKMTEYKKRSNKLRMVHAMLHKTCSENQKCKSRNNRLYKLLF